MEYDKLGTHILDAAFYIHQELGPGLLESVYEAVLSSYLIKRGVSVQRQVPIPVVFDGVKLEEGFRADLLVDGMVMVELKSVERIDQVHKKQLLTYLKLSGIKLG